MNRNIGPIGLDLGTASIKMLQLSGPEDDLSAVASARYDLPGDIPSAGPERRAVLIEACRKLYDSAPFRGRRVVSCLPVSTVRYKNIRLPKMPVDELRQAVEWEAADRLDMENQELTAQYLFAGDVRQGNETRQEIILMGCPSSDVREHVELLNESGLDPEAIDTVPTALGRCFSRTFRRQSDSETTRVYVDVGDSCSKVIILRGRQIVFFKLIDIGGAQLHARVAEHLDLSVDDAARLRRRLTSPESESEEGEPLFGSTRRESVQRAAYEAVRSVVSDLAKEIGLCLRYYSVTFRGARPTSLVLVGGEAHEPQLAKVIAEQLEIDVTVADPLAGIDLSSADIAIERRGTLPEWSTAAGLALRWRMPGSSRKRGAA